MDGKPGSAPAGAKLAAYIGHDTNIANVGGMLGLSWQPPRYQKDQMPPAGALLFKLRERAPGERLVNVAYVAQSLDDMRNGTGTKSVRTPVAVPGRGGRRAMPACRVRQGGRGGAGSLLHTIGGAAAFSGRCR